jgi:16S rRNA (cytidine1402-2'-O)-methyltransferase
MFGTLYIVATPIGNLEDITFRAVRVLKEADLIACEDTRHTKILLARYEISKPLVSYHQHSRLQKVEELLAELGAGKNIAVVSDAGTPGISDPGGMLVKRALESGINVVPIPGPSALSALASVAGIPMERFLFLGFLPHKKGRETLFKKILESEMPVIFYESPHRFLKTLEVLARSDGRVIVGRELTKKFEEVVRGPAREVFEKFSDKKILGEFVIIYYK